MFGKSLRLVPDHWPCIISYLKRLAEENQLNDQAQQGGLHVLLRIKTVGMLYSLVVNKPGTKATTDNVVELGTADLVKLQCDYFLKLPSCLYLLRHDQTLSQKCCFCELE